MPSVRMVEVVSASGYSSRTRAANESGSATASILLNTTSSGRSARSSSASTRSTTRICPSQSGWLASTTCSRTSAARASSSVARKLATRWCGSLRMKPTVSVTRARWPSPSSTSRVSVSSVANSRSSTKISCCPESARRMLDLPALVYPTRDTLSIGSRPARRFSRCRSTPCSLALSPWMRWRMIRRSVSSWVSPGPRRPMPPRMRERWVHMRVSLGSRYSSCASSTCSFASWLRARVEKMSRMTSGRSMTRTLSSRSRLAPWTGLSSSSKMTSVAPASATAAATSSTFPSPISVAGLGDADLLRHASDHLRTRGVHQPGELFEMLGDVTGVLRPLAWRGDEHRALDGIANLYQCPDVASSIMVTGRHGEVPHRRRDSVAPDLRG